MPHCRLNGFSTLVRTVSMGAGLTKLYWCIVAKRSMQQDVNEPAIIVSQFDLKLLKGSIPPVVHELRLDGLAR